MGVAAAGPAKLSRVVLGAVLGLLFIGAWTGSGPGAVDANSPSYWNSELNAASLKNTMNNGETKGAPQQTVSTDGTPMTLRLSQHHKTRMWPPVPPETEHC